MSELNEELLNDVAEDLGEIGEADEDALLQDDDDEDVLNIAPEFELAESEDHKNPLTESQDKKSSRKDKFATERKIITAPESSSDEQPNNNRFRRQNNNFRGRGRGGRFHQHQGRYNNQPFNQGRQYNNNFHNQSPYNGSFNNHQTPYNNYPETGRSKTVLINPRFQGVVHVNNNARLAWDNPPQQFNSPWAQGSPQVNMNPQMQGPPQMQFQQQPMHQFQCPPNMQQGPPMPMNQGPPMLMNQGSPMQQGVPINQGPPMQNDPHMHQGPPIQFIPPQHQQQFVPQPLPPGVPHGQMQPPKMTASASYWDGQNHNFQGPNQQQMPYNMQNNFETQQLMTHPNQQQNYHYNNQFPNNGPPMHGPPMQNYNQQNRRVFTANRKHMRQGHNNVSPAKRELTSPKRKMNQGNSNQNKKRFIHERLGTVDQSQVRINNVSFKTEDRPSVVKEVTVTNVTTVKIQEEDEQTRDLRLRIEEQKRQREEFLRVKEQRRLETLKTIKCQNPQQQSGPKIINTVEQGQNKKPVFRQQHLKSPSGRISVLQTVRQVGDQHHVKGRPNLQNVAQNSNMRVIANVPMVKDAPAEVQVDQKHLSNFLADRKVLVKDEALLSTRTVTIKNIATSTGDKKILQICKNIGEVQKLQRDKNESHATITFKSVASAHAFFKKYQRHMLDLSMIEVSLSPESDEQEE